jgi:acetyltransferase-like isoleucine patch superfamily enzyme
MDNKEIIDKGNSNPAYEYNKIINRFRLFRNTIICYICKLLPLKKKNSLYRLLSVKIGKNVVIAPYLQIDPFFPEIITLENNVIIGW